MKHTHTHTHTHTHAHARTHTHTHTHAHTHTHTRLTAPFPGLPSWVGTRKVKPIWILLKQKTVSGSGISWAICKSAPHSRQITMRAPHHSVFYRPDALPAAQPTVSKHWRQINRHLNKYKHRQKFKNSKNQSVSKILVEESGEHVSCAPEWPCQQHTKCEFYITN